MMIKSKSIVVVIIGFVFSLSSAHAQVPGYLGKRLAVSYNLNWNIKGLFDGDNPVALKAKHLMEADIVLGKHTTLFLQYGFKKLDKKSDQYFLIHGPLVNTSGGEVSTFIDWKYYEYKVSQMGFGFKITLKGTIAPLGTYLKFGFASMSYKRKNPEYRVSGSNNNTDTSFIMTDKEVYRAKRLMIGLGRRVIVKNNLFLDYGANIGFVFGFPARHKSHISDYVANSSQLKASEWYHLHIGAGILF